MDLLLIAVVGAVVGSFINVVIYRLPRIMAGANMTLSWPPSGCPGCHSRIKARHNIPVLSWLWLRGQCHVCRQRISWQYPVVELLMAALYVGVLLAEGVTLQSMVDILLLSLMVPMFFIDYHHFLLPDRLTFPFIAVALIAALSGSAHIDFMQALPAALTGFMIPWLLDRLYLWRHRRHGMGLGDMKLMAGMGAWLGMEALFQVMLAASVLGLVAALFLFRVKRQQTLPFGPCLIIASIGAFFISAGLN